MFSHVTVGTNDMKSAVDFYNALLLPLGLRQRQVTPDGGPASACWVKPQSALPRFYVYSPFNGKPATNGNGSMVAFLAESEEMVDLAYQAGIDAGGLDGGKPGHRVHYGEGYYGSYLYDLDGNKVHVVYRGDVV